MVSVLELISDTLREKNMRLRSCSVGSGAWENRFSIILFLRSFAKSSGLFYLDLFPRWYRALGCKLDYRVVKADCFDGFGRTS